MAKAREARSNSKGRSRVDAAVAGDCAALNYEEKHRWVGRPL
jgi:hypothetical protein